MKIVYCIPTLGVAGAERQIARVASELAGAGHDVHVAFTTSGPNEALLRAAGAVLHPMRTRGSHDPRLVLQLISLFRRIRPDVVQTTLMQMDVAAGIAALLTRTPWVLRESSVAQTYASPWKASLRRWLGRRAAAIVSNSQGGDAYWRDAGARRRHVVGNAVPHDEIAAAEPIATEQPLVLFAGRLDDGKNVGTLIDALVLLARDTEFTAMICGDGVHRRDLIRTVDKHGLRGRILFPGIVDDVWQRMKSAAVCVSLSRWEGEPNAVLEAMACGAPLVLSDIAAHRAVAEGRATFVDPDDAAAAASALRAALSGARATPLRSAAREVAAVARAYAAVYESVLR